MSGKYQCPYVKAHWILPARYAKHLEQCKKQFPNMDIRTCEFKSTHHVTAAEYDEHIRTCPFRRVFERAIAPVGAPAAVVAPVLTEAPNVGEQEDWSGDNFNSYLDVQKQILEKRDILSYGELNTGKAKRKEFRQKEKQRLDNLTNK